MKSVKWFWSYGVTKGNSDSFLYIYRFLYVFIYVFIALSYPIFSFHVSNVHIYCYVLVITHYSSKNSSKENVRCDCMGFIFSFPLFQFLFWHTKVVWFNKGKEFHKYFIELILSNFVKYSCVITLSRRACYLSIFLVCKLCALWIRKLNQWMFIKLPFHEENCGDKNLRETFR